MEVLVAIATLFVIGSVIGYIIELFYRRFVSQKRWVNPGFMVGPYIPLYGFGVIILYGISNFGIQSTSLPDWAKVLITLAIIGVLLTLIELIAGLIFIKLLHLKLWDYSDRWGNFKGLICPLFSLIWFAAGALYYFFLNPVIVDAVMFVSKNTIYDFFIGIVVGMMIVDFAYSLHLGFKIKKFSADAVIKFEQLKVNISKKREESEHKGAFYAMRFLNKDNFTEISESSKIKFSLFKKKEKNE